MKKIWILFILCINCFLVACDDVFSYHPYDVDFGGNDFINTKNIESIERNCNGKEAIRFAVISDTHGWFTETKTIVDDINRREEIDFVVHCGDLTDCATMKEYKWTRDILDRLRMPYLALIGNHDMLGTGEEIFREMFGDVDMSFIVGRVKFICLNTNATEYNYMASVPNFDFLAQEASTDNDLFDRTIVFMHSPPFSDQFNNNVANIFLYYCKLTLPNLQFCINGHEHRTTVTYRYDNDEIPYYEVGCAKDLQYLIFTITPDGYSYETISL